MNEQLRIQEIVERYFRLRTEEEKIFAIKNIIKNNKDKSIKLTIDINGECFDLSNLFSDSNKDYKELDDFMSSLLFANNDYKEAIITKLKLKEDKVNKETLLGVKTEEINKGLNLETNKEPAEDSIDLETSVTNILNQLDRGEVVVAGEILEYLKKELDFDIELSDINQILSAKLKKGELNSIYFVKCYKCNSGYEDYLDKLPRITSCPDCREEILNVELRFKKAY